MFGMEKIVEKYLINEIERLGGLCVKFPPLFFRGFPDRIVLLPGAVIAFVETKDTGKKPRPIQERVHAKLRKLGFRVEVIDSKEGVDDFIMTL
jgi:hypothetical protein